MVLFLVLLFGELTNSNNPSLITIEYPNCETKVLSINWVEQLLQVDFTSDIYFIKYHINIDIQEFVLTPVGANFNIDYSQLKYSYNILPDGITCTTDGRIYGKVESRPAPNDGAQFISKITVSYLNTVLTELSIVWDCQDIYIDELEPTR